MNWRRAAAIGAASSLAFVGLVGVAHAPPFRALLRATTSCPIGGDLNATNAEREASRQQALAYRLGSSPAPAKKIFGFDLGTDTKSVVDAWTSSHHARCTPSTSGLVLECEVDSLAAFGLEVPGTVFFKLDDHERIKALLVTSKVPLEQSGPLAETLTKQVEATFGPAHGESGHVDEQPLSQQRREHHFSDLFASVARTQMGNGVRLNLEVQAL